MLPLLAGTLAGAAYFVLARLIGSWRRWLDPLTAGYLIGGPFAAGLLSVAASGSLAAAWLAVALGVAVQLLLRMHRLLSVLMAMPLFLLGSAAGGLLGLALLAAEPSSATLIGVSAVVALLPVAVAMLETGFAPASDRRDVRTQTVVRARPETIWANVVRVSPIEPREWALYRVLALLGFPAPERAVLSNDGPRGLRQGIFSGAVLFDEPVLEWRPGERIRVAVRVRHESLAGMPFDDFTRIGGDYFNMVTAEYRLEAIDAEHTRVHLDSTHRLTTRLNGYAGWWSGLVLRTFQRSILALVKARCERLEAQERREAPLAA
jgi:hypothetical protein